MQRQEGGLWGRGQPPKQVGGCWGYKERPEPSRETFISQDHVFKSRRLLHHARNKMRPPYLSTRYSLHGLSSITGQSLVCIVGSVNYTSLEPGLFYSGLSWASLTCQMVKYVKWAQAKICIKYRKHWKIYVIFQLSGQIRLLLGSTKTAEQKLKYATFEGGFFNFSWATNKFKIYLKTL